MLIRFQTSTSAPPAPTSTPAPAPAETPIQAIAKPNNAKAETKNDKPKDTPKQEEAPKENNSAPAPSVGGLLTIGSACGASGATGMFNNLFVSPLF